MKVANQSWGAWVCQRAGFGALAMMIVAGTLLSPSTGQAAGNDAAAAEALFDAGRTLLKEKKFLKAAEKFAASQRLDPGIGTLFYLADALEKGERYASAWAQFRAAGSLAEQAGQKDRLAIARERAQKLKARLSTLTVQVPEGVRVKGLVVKRGDSKVVSSMFGVPAPIDGGAYTVSASAPGYETWSTEVSVGAEKDQVVVKLETLTAKPDPPKTAAAPTGPTAAQVAAQAEAKKQSEARQRQGSLMRGFGYGTGALGLVGLGLGGYFLGDAFSADEDANALCGPASCTTQEGQDLSARSVTSSRVATAGFAVGGAALTTGVLLLILAPSADDAPEDAESTFVVTPTVGANQWGLTAGGRW